MDRLSQAVGMVGCCVLLADSDGVPVDRRGAMADDAAFQSWGLWTGAIWSEASEGTNGIGTCLVEQRALTIDRDQHFLGRNTEMSCTAAPIYDHNAQLAGVLDVSSCRADSTYPFTKLIAIAVNEAVRRIEAEMFRSAFTGTGIRIQLTPPVEGGFGGLVAIDADDLIIGATKCARTWLGIVSEGSVQPVPATDLFFGPYAECEHLGDAERRTLQRTLLRSHGNVSAAAKALGVSRATLHRKLKRLRVKPH